MINKPTQVPGIPKSPADASPQTRAWLDSVAEALEIRLGRRGDPKDRAITLRELIESGLAQELKANPFDPNNINSSNIGLTNPRQNLDIPPTPVNFSASGAYSQIHLSWDYPNYSNHAFTEIYGHDSDVIGDAQLVGISDGLVYIDPVGSGVSRYYWVRHVSTSDVVGPFNSGTGTLAQTATDVAHQLAVLADAITSSELAQSLKTPIENLPADTSGAIANIQSQINTLSTVEAWASGTSYIVNDLATYSGKLYEAKTAHTSSSSNQPTGTTSDNSTWKFVGEYTSLASAVAGNTGNIADINYISSSSNSAAAQKIAALDSVVSDSSTGVAATSTALSGLTTRVTNTENATGTNSTNITSMSNDITQLQSDVSNAATGVTANSTAVTNLTTRVTNTENATTANSADITSLENTVNNSTSGVAATATAVTGLTTRVTNTESATSTNTSNITSNTSAITALENTVNDSSTGLSATATGLSNLTTRVTNTESATSTNTSNISSISSDVTALENTVNNSTTGVTATASALSTLESRVTSTEGDITSVTSDVTTLNTTVGNNSTSIQTNSSSINGLEGKYTVKIDNNGHVAGFGLASSNNNGTPSSAFIVRADKFAVIDPADTSNNLTNSPSTDKVPFIISGGDTYLRSAMIQDASITTAKVGSLSADKITFGTMHGDRISANTLNANRISTNSLDVGGKAIQDSIGRIAGIAGREVSMTSYPRDREALLSSIFRDSATPRHIASSAASVQGPDYAQYDVMGGSPIFTHTFQTYAFTGLRTFIIHVGVDFNGSYDSDSRNQFAFAMRATSSSSAYTSTNNNDYVTSKGTSYGGTLGVGNQVLNAQVSLSPNTYYTIYAFAEQEDVDTAAGFKGVREGFNSVMGLNK